MIELRKYQHDCIAASMAGWNQFSKQLIVAPTGSGKAVLMSKMAESVLPKRTLILCHREELITQAAARVKAVTGIDAEIEKAEQWATKGANIVCASVQTMQGKRLERWEQDHFGLVICDEAHHSISDSWQNTLKRFDSHAWVWGCTATPARSDAKNLGCYYENVAFEIGLFDLIEQGYLSRISIKCVPIQIDLNHVRTTNGDLNESDLSDAITPHFRAIVQAIKEHATFRKTVVFLPLCATSRAFVSVCNSEGIKARHIDGESEDRKQILAEFAAGEFDLLSNAMLLSEGWDEPSVDCIVTLRPTKSHSLFCQQVGRGTRVAPYKKDLLLLDFLYQSERHNLIRPANLIATTEDQARAITALTEEKSKGGSQDELDLQSLASEEREKREERLRNELKSKAKRDPKHIDAMEWCMNMGAHDLVDYEPSMKWEEEPMTEKQGKLLKRAGIDISTIKGKGHASKLINVHIKNQKETPASPGQKKIMQKRGYHNWEHASADEARKFFATINRKTVEV